MKLTPARRSSIATSIISDMAAGTAANPKIQIYTGSLPAAMGGTIAGTLLAELETTVGAATKSGGTITFDAIENDASANNTGTAGWARVIDRDGAEALYLSVSVTGGSGDLKLNTLSIEAGGPVAITSATITVGAA